MKILIVIPKMYGGGAEHCGAIWANGFSKAGHQVLVASDFNNKIAFSLSNEIKCIQLFPVYYNKLLKWSVAIWHLKKWIANEKPDIIIGIMAAAAFAAKVSCLFNNIPVIMTEHNPFERPSNVNFSFKEKFFKFYLNKVYDGITVITRRDKEVIGSRLSNVHVMPNPLCIEPQKIVPPKKKYILAVGRLDSWYVKGFDLLIKAWGSIAKAFPDWCLIIAGTGNVSNFHFLQSLVDRYSISSQVIFKGYVEDICYLYQEASIFVLSSRYEGFGLVLIEAMSQGCACIACDFMGRQKEIIINEEQGLICPTERVDELMESIKKLIINDTYRRMLQENGIERSKFYKSDLIINKWLELLSSIIQTKTLLSKRAF